MSVGHFIKAIGLLLFCHSLSAKTTVDEAISRFVEVNPSLVAAENRKLSAHNLVKEARGRFLPSIEVVGQMFDEKNVFYFGPDPIVVEQKRYLAGLQFEQPIYLGGRIRNGYRLRRRQVEQAESEYRKTKNNELRGLLSRIYRWLSADEQLKILRESQNTQSDFAKIARRKGRRGAALPFELDQVEADLLSYLPRIEVATEQKLAVEREIRADLQWPEQQAVAFGWPNVQTRKEIAEADWLKQALKNRPDAQMTTLSVELAEIEKSLDLGEELPSLAISGTYGYTGPDSAAIGESNAQYETIGLSLKIPLFSGLSSLYLRRSGQLKIEAAQADLKRFQQRVRSEVMSARTQLNSASRRVKLTEEWSTKASRALRLGLRSYRVGRVSIAQVVQLQAGRERAALAVIEAKANYLTALLNWKIAIGEDISE